MPPKSTAGDQVTHLTGMTGGGVNASFVYDGDGNRVKGTVAGVTTGYVGDYLEWTGNTSTMKKYYYAGTTRVAMRIGSNNPLWLFGDHLGSTSKVINNDGLTENSQELYKPWGEKRYPTGAPTVPTTFQFTGQRHEKDLGPAGGEGLYYYGARWYDPAVGRFTQPDTLIPQQQGVQAWDRFAYSSGNPVKYIDPTGHWPDVPNWLNPFSYDTWSISFKGLGKVILGIDIDINISVDTRPIRQGYAKGGVGGAIEGMRNTDVEVSTVGNVSVGLSGEAIVGVGVTGSEGGVSDQNGFSLIGQNGIPVNYSAVIPPVGEPSIAVFGGTTINTNSKNGVASSQTWGLGYGAGFVDVSGDVVTARDWILYGHEKNINLQFPFVNEKFFYDVKNTFYDLFNKAK